MIPSRLGRAAALVRPFRLAVAGILVLTLLSVAVGAFEPLAMKWIIDELSGGRRAAALVRLILVLVGLGVAREVLGAIANRQTWRTRLELNFNLLEDAVGRLHQLPLSFHQEAGVGATMTKLDRGIQGFVAAFSEVAFTVVPALAYLVIAMVVMVSLDWRLAVLVIAFAPLPAIITALAAPEQTRRERAIMDRWWKIYGRFQEVLAGILTVKSFAMEEREKDRFLEDVGAANRLVERGVGRDAAIGGLQNVVVMGARIAALGAGGALVLSGEIGVGTLLAFLGYVAGLFGPVQGLTTVYRTIHKAQVSLDGILEVLDAKDALADAPGARELERPRGAFSFRGVRFSHDGRRELLKGIDLEVRAGERVALVGPSGAGKTTLMNLLQRFYDPSAGHILVDGHDLRDLRQRSLRGHIGVVLQDALLFNDSVRANIVYGRPDASLRDIAAAARAANAHEMILALPDGYETSVGERGGRLAGGERQRVAIARALLKDPPILILDEATAALDVEAEAQVQEALDRLTRGRTTFVIAHRLSTVVNADRIVVLADGRILEQGTHEELVARGGRYASLWRRQTRGLRSA